MKILRIALPVPLRKTFDYLCPLTEGAALVPGMRILVPFQRRQLVGIYLETVSKTDIDPKKLKPIVEILDKEPLLSPAIMKLCLWAADYYHHAVGEVLHAALPTLLRGGRKGGGMVVPPLPSPLLHQKHGGEGVFHECSLSSTLLVEERAGERRYYHASAPLPLNPAQATIVEAISASLDGYSVATIDGVTGSGKTEVYLQIIAHVIQQQKQVLVLVPEINLTPQTIARFEQRFSVPVVAMHSGLTEKKRLSAWLAARSGEALIIIGTRSAVFTSVPNLGLIIVDEEHDSSFKQQDSFRYNARDLAIWRARDVNVPIILGSATPSLETLHRSWGGHYRYFVLPERAGGAQLPTFKIIDIRRQYLEEGLSPPLLQEMTKHLAAGNQVLLFLNRRGFSPVLMCHACGWMATCKHCDARMTYHLRPLRLHCHYCEAQLAVPKRCEKCGEQELNTLGMGTERLELALQKYFPEVPLLRIDRDTTRRKGQMEAMLAGIQCGQYRILIGTQMVAKGHHFPNVTLVGIIDSDYGLFSSDFRASERLGQLILQVAGRAGREAKPGVVWIQTHQPDHPLLQLLREGNYQQFAKSLLIDREQALLPPYSSLVLFHAEAHRVSEVEQFLTQVKEIAQSLNAKVSIRGPVAAIMARRAGRHRMQLLLQADQKKTLQSFLRVLLRRVELMANKVRIHWAVDVDPMEMG